MDSSRAAPRLVDQESRARRHPVLAWLHVRHGHGSASRRPDRRAVRRRPARSADPALAPAKARVPAA